MTAAFCTSTIRGTCSLKAIYLDDSLVFDRRIWAHVHTRQFWIIGTHPMVFEAFPSLCQSGHRNERKLSIRVLCQFDLLLIFPFSFFFSSFISIFLFLSAVAYIRRMSHLFVILIGNLTIPNPSSIISKTNAWRFLTLPILRSLPLLHPFYHVLLFHPFAFSTTIPFVRFRDTDRISLFLSFSTLWLLEIRDTLANFKLREGWTDWRWRALAHLRPCRVSFRSPADASTTLALI